MWSLARNSSKFKRLLLVGDFTQEIFRSIYIFCLYYFQFEVPSCMINWIFLENTMMLVMAKVLQTSKALLDRIAWMESEAQKSFMHRSVNFWDLDFILVISCFSFYDISELFIGNLVILVACNTKIICFQLLEVYNEIVIRFHAFGVVSPVLENANNLSILWPYFR